MGLVKCMSLLGSAVQESVRKHSNGAILPRRLCQSLLVLCKKNLTLPLYGPPVIAQPTNWIVAASQPAVHAPKWQFAGTAGFTRTLYQVVR